MDEIGDAAVVVGVGNLWRGDDAAGLLVVQKVRAANVQGVRVIESDGDGLGLLEAWAGATTAYVVDATRSGCEPGTIVRLEVSSGKLPATRGSGGTHGQGLADAVELARVLKLLPRRLVVYGIEGRDFESGAAVTPHVDRAASEVAERVLAELRG